MRAPHSHLRLRWAASLCSQAGAGAYQQVPNWGTLCLQAPNQSWGQASGSQGTGTALCAPDRTTEFWHLYVCALSCSWVEFNLLERAALLFKGLLHGLSPTKSLFCNMLPATLFPPISAQPEGSVSSLTENHSLAAPSDSWGKNWPPKHSGAEINLRDIFKQSTWQTLLSLTFTTTKEIEYFFFSYV